MPVQAAVDLSNSLGPARCQGQRSTCMAFAMSDLNRAASGAPEVLSAEFLYRAAGALTRLEPWAGLTGHRGHPGDARAGPAIGDPLPVRDRRSRGC